MPLEPEVLTRASETVFQAVRTGASAAQLTAAFAFASSDEHRDGLAIQLDVLRRFRAEGRQLAGWKIGLTSRDSRNDLGPGFRPFGYVLADRSLESGQAVPLSGLQNGWVEPEIGLTIARPLAGAEVMPEQARAAVGTLHAAFEILDRRIAPSAKTPMVRLADGLSNWGLVFGPGVPIEVDLSRPAVRLERGGVLVDTGFGGIEVVDDPFVSLARLARQLHQFGLGLHPGQRVITGSLLAPVALTTPGIWTATIEHLGHVELRVRA